MAMKHLTEKLHKIVRTFRSQRNGNVTITFALTLIPLIGLVGAAVDYSRANSARTAMQAALDSTALMLSKEAPSLTSSQMTQKAKDYFNAMFTRPEALNTTLALNYNATGDSLTLSGSANVNTTFTRVIGKTQMAIGSSTTVKWGMSRLRVALVLDNTGSMASAGKMTALKTATANLLTMLKSAATTNGDVYVSIIPFNKDVNVGKSNSAASWIDWTAWNAANGTGGSSGGIVDLGGGKYCFQGQIWYWNGSSLTIIGTCSSGTPDHSSWNGCVTDRGASTPPGTTAGYDQKVDAPVAGNTATLYAAEQYSACPVQMMGLSYDWNAMNAQVNSMQPNGTTNQPIGLVWGWLSLVGGGPFTAPAMDPSYPYQKVIILLSDGLNTQDRWYGNGSSVSTEVDARMYNPADGSGTCKNIKDAGITIYTVQVNTDGDPTSTLLKNCASDASKFFMLTSASEIVTTFNQIGTKLAKLRIAK